MGGSGCSAAILFFQACIRQDFLTIMKTLVKVAVGLAAANGLLIAAKYGRTQHELKDATWFRESVLKVAQHEGIHNLIGPPPLELGDASRFPGNQYEPLKEVTPEPVAIVEVPVKGSVGEGNIRMYLNFLVPIEQVRKDINAWNLALLEVQIGKNKEHRFLIN
ncbi:tRNA-guanine(15) transglycosylase [Frankliniella fusca]|uniref:tRNA-guanine(15) transglycosylase n=1 Tax=Frankliniella fusca TaxID=407009 RepID=A0AAE1H2A2_9NEOP|nr:tRNA-guanine(15) transglycosylase [Frankliniella fusca]